MLVTCPYCKENRWIYKTHLQANKSRGSKFTSRCKGCADIANSGENNYNWKGGRGINAQGYVRVRIDGKYKLEHRYVMEKHLGRKLESWEIVHHKDGNRQNNDINNIELHKPKDHDTITLLMRENRKLRAELKKYHEQFVNTDINLL